MIEVEGMIHNQSISTLIDSGASRSYIDPKLVERLRLEKHKHEHSWTVQLATRTRREVRELVRSFPMNLNGLMTVADLNMLPLGSYDMFVGMDSLESHHAILDFRDKVVSCLDDEGQ